MFMYPIPSQSVYIKNDTNSKIKDLHFIIPQTDAKSKVKSILVDGYVEEIIVDRYNGDLRFYFLDNESKIYTFKDVIKTMHKENYKNSLVFKVIETNGEREIIFVSNELKDILKNY